MFDIHSHILPATDDGANDMEESLKLLELMQAEGITHVMATPHFYPQDTNLEFFLKVSNSAFRKLVNEIQGRNLPKIFLGCEMLYFEGMGNSLSLKPLCLNGSRFLLLELTDNVIKERLFKDIDSLTQNIGIMPIIAHTERYFRAKNFKKLLKYVVENHIPVQLNAESFSIPYFKKAIKKIIKSGAIIILGTDTHSVDARPPMLKSALAAIEKNFGKECKEKIISNSEMLFRIIVKEGDLNEK